MRRIGLGILLWLVAARWASAEIRFLSVHLIPLNATELRLTAGARPPSGL